MVKFSSNDILWILFLYYSFGVEKTNTFIRSRGSLENHTRFKTIMVKIYTRFQTKTAQTPCPWGGTYLYSLYGGVTPTPPPPPRATRVVKSLKINITDSMQLRICWVLFSFVLVLNIYCRIAVFVPETHNSSVTNLGKHLLTSGYASRNSV